MDHKLLSIYMNDHLAGSVVGKNLARRIAERNEGNEYGRKMSEIAREIEEDQLTLLGVMQRAGVRRKQVRLALARLTEMATRLKPNGRLVGYSPLSRVLDLEGLTVGITGKLELWRSLHSIEGDPDVPEADYAGLASRAEDQRDRVEELRVRAAAEALGDGNQQTPTGRPG
jgi:hypothetical protein